MEAPRGAFTVSRGALAGTYDAVLISTDLEPDDAAAIKFLAPRLRGVELLVVVGEGNLLGKTSLAANMLASYGLGAVRVLQGRRSAESYPSCALAAWGGSSEAEAATAATAAQEEAIAMEACDSFLRRHSSPLVLLLKPPHELLGVAADVLSRTVAAAYGSFNFRVFRKVMCNEDQNLHSDGSMRKLESFASSFKTFFWLERSLSVGRDAVLDRQHVLWPDLSSDAGLMIVTREWNKRTIRSMAGELGSSFSELAAACDWSIESLEVLRSAAETLSKDADPSYAVAIILSIVSNDLEQMPFADPLVAAVLLDDDGFLEPFEQRCRVTLDHAGRPECEPDADSSVVMLLAGEKARQGDVLVAASSALGGNVGQASKARGAAGDGASGGTSIESGDP